MYHQVNELIFKMILWEMKQISYCENIETVFFTERLMRISRYFDMLTTFSVLWKMDGSGSIHEVQKHFDSCERFSKRPVSIN
jgi:tryptophan 2,3-dioxygenase